MNWWCHNSISETWTAICGRQASFKALPPSIFAWIWRLSCQNTFPLSHLGLIWLLSVSKTTRVFTGLVGTSAANKRKKEVVYPSLAWKSCQNRCLGKMLWDLIHIFLFTSGWDKLRPRGYNVASRARSLWAMSARVIQTVSEWARMCQSEPDCARVSQTVPEWARLCQSEPECEGEPEREPDWAYESQIESERARVDQRESMHINQLKNWGSFVTKR